MTESFWFTETAASPAAPMELVSTQLVGGEGGCRRGKQKKETHLVSKPPERANVVFDRNLSPKKYAFIVQRIHVQAVSCLFLFFHICYESQPS